jgi:hypothetical protein
LLLMWWAQNNSASKKIGNNLAYLY